MAGVSSSTEPTMKQASFNEDSLGEFLNRPVKIAAIEWSPGTTFINTYEPWSLWATNAQIKKKLDNFRNFRGTLKISFKINGSPFHYGKIMASYRPLHNYSDLQEPTHSTASSIEFLQSMMIRSQRLNVKMDPRSDAGGCLCLPLIIPDNYLAVNSLAQWSDAGELTVESMMDLRTASSSTDVVTITIFAQMVDIDLTVPTYSVAAQGEKEVEEMSDGKISRPAALVAKAAKVLEDIPVIRPFAIVTGIAASTVATVASLFGFSRPTLVDVTRFIRRNPAGELAHTSGADNVNKLTMDPKQSVTVDPRVVGLDGEDEMAVSYIAQREGFLSYFEWSQTDAVDKILFWTAVHPCLAREWPGTYSDSIAVTPICFASLPFSHWSGSLKFRIEVMASQWHKGRLRIVYDPVSYANAVATDNYNTNFVKILDLAETRNFEFTIPWGQNTPYKLVNSGLSNRYYLDPVSGASSTTPDISYHNGFLGFSVVNELISNDTTASIRVNVYVSAGDDYELQGPTGDAIRYLKYFPLVNPQPQGDMDYTEENKPDSSSNSMLLTTPTPDVHELKAKVFFGDPVVSFRSLLKRYNLHMITELTAATTDTLHNTYLFRYVMPDFPEYGGYDPSSNYVAAVSGPLNETEYTPAFTPLIHYLTPAYVCRRGGMRWKYKPNGPMLNQNERVNSFRVFRSPRNIKAQVAQIEVANAAYTFTDRLINSIYNIDYNMVSGAWTGLWKANNLINVEIPFYNGKRFFFAQNLNILNGLLEDESAHAKHIVDIQFTMPVTSESNAYKHPTAVEKWVSAGDDFSLMYFQNAPMFLTQENREVNFNTTPAPPA